MDQPPSIPVEKLSAIAGGHPKLRLLLLFGSRAHGDTHERSDWDFGYLADAGMDPDALLLDLVKVLGTDRVDVVDLARAGAQIGFRAAADAQVLYEAEPGLFGKYWIEAVNFWCDVEPVLRAGYADVLARLRR
jgi:predicted nucleotidyltransferase